MSIPFYARRVSLEELPSWAVALIESERVARLAFVDDDDRPRVLPVTYAVAEDVVWSAIDDKPKRAAEPARVRYLRRRPEAALCVDRYDDDWNRLAWVQVLGRVEVLPIERGAAGLEALTAKYAQYRERRPPGPLLRLQPSRALHWRSTGSPRRDHSLQDPG
jgi:PPOX class probable F420-dependent enzyme